MLTAQCSVGGTPTACPETAAGESTAGLQLQLCGGWNRGDAAGEHLG